MADGKYYMVDSTLNIEASTATAVIEGTANFSAKDVTGTYTVPAEDFTLNGAVKVTLNDGIKAELADGTDVPSGSFVKASTALTITVPTTAGTSAIDLTGTDDKHVADADDIVSGTSKTTGTADMNLYAAVKVTLSGSTTAYYRVDGMPVNLTAGVYYITPGVELYTPQANTITDDGTSTTIAGTTIGSDKHFTLEGAVTIS